MSSSSLAVFFAQVTNAAAGAASAAAGTDGTTPPDNGGFLKMVVFYIGVIAMVYFVFLRPQQLAKKKAEETIKGAKTGDKIVTTGGIHGLITNVKDTTVIVKVADNVKLEIEKSHIDKITRPDAEPEKAVTAKVS